MNSWKIALLILLAGNSFGQIELSEESEAVKEEKKREQKAAEISSSKNSSIQAIVYSTWSSSNRILEMNDEPYGDSLFQRADEGKLGVWSFGLGIRSAHGRYFSWEGGISYMKNGESYLFETADSMYSYETRYAYLGMPFQAFFNYKYKAATFYLGGGLVPQIFSRYKQSIEYRTSTNNTVTEEISTNSGYNSFVLSAKISCGIDLSMGAKTSFFIFPEYRAQLISSYVKIDDYKHFARAFNIKLGLSYTL